MVILAGMIKTSRVVAVIFLGLVVALLLPAFEVNWTLSVFIAFAVMLVVVSVLATRAEGRRSKGAIARDEARTSGGGRE
jgi:membrane protein implicated in regulation of membrane protease activity